MYPTFVALSLVGVMLYMVFRRLLETRGHRRLAAGDECKLPAVHHHKDPLFGTDELHSMIAAAKSKKYLERINELYTAHGNTYSCNYLFSTTINTIEPENIKTILVTKFHHFGMGKSRHRAFYPLLGESIILTDGTQWEHSRKVLRPSFTRSQVGETPRFESHVLNLLDCIGTDLNTVDLGELFFRLTADTTTDMLFGKSVQSLKYPEAFGNEFVKAFQDAQVGGEERWRLGRLADWIPNRKFWESIKVVNAFIEEYVQAALLSRSENSTEAKSKNTHEENGAKRQERYIFAQELAKLTDSHAMIRDELLTIFFAGRDTTAGLLTNLFFMLSKHPEIWNRIRDEVANFGRKHPTYAELSTFTYVKQCLNECK
jgi:cytochrome P450